ncbi:hypothetical protein [Deferrisoma camini]|uniref:hypothetical protein n=1 Tax=Deferrisoma camini TaxID=1035120 RepID=UPI00046CEFCF|nr:hypothetical protein [Deferrisoma camini]
MNFEALTLETVGDGELQAIFEASVQEVLRDIEDEAKVRTATRTITLTIQITPHERDNAVDIVVSGNTKLAKRVAVRTLGVIDDRGKLLQYRDRQESLPFADNVEPFPAEKEETQ